MKAARTSTTLVAGPSLLAALLMNLAFPAIAVKAIGTKELESKKNPIPGQQAVLSHGGWAMASSRLVIGILGGASDYVWRKYSKVGLLIINGGSSLTRSSINRSYKPSTFFHPNYLSQLQPEAASHGVVPT